MMDEVESLDIERSEFISLYQSDGNPSWDPCFLAAFKSIEKVISFVSTGSDVWSVNIRSLMPTAKVFFVQPKPPTQWTRHVRQWHLAQLREQGLILQPPPMRLRSNENGPVVIHPGSGSVEKCWPPDRFEKLAYALQRRGKATRIVLGEVELATWPRTRLRRWSEELGAEIMTDLDTLRTAVEEASFYIGNDSGPTHLAAQAGIRTLALFGPTCARIWAPVGPMVRIVAPSEPQPMTWLVPDVVLDAFSGVGAC